MIVVRDVFQAKYGRGDELVALLQEIPQIVADAGIAPTHYRILTDASGPFFTIVTETEMPSMGEWEQQFAHSTHNPIFGEWFSRMIPLVEHGRREFYTIVEG
jgi:hypothetical protein